MSETEKNLSEKKVEVEQKGKRGLKVDKEKGHMASRGLKLGSVMAVFQELLEENPEVSFREAIEKIKNRQSQKEEKIKEKK